jgi:SAM-dependent methyltransferase
VSRLAKGLEVVHKRGVAKRRARVLSRQLAEIIPQDAEVLDVGCGDGEIAWLVGQARPDLRIRGVDVLVRPDTRIPVEQYDGSTLPCTDKSCDVVTLIDVLHHCDDPRAVLGEAARVARQAVVIKDHTREGVGAAFTLRLMDWVGNHQYGVTLPYNYWSQSEWQAAFEGLGMAIELKSDRLQLYPWPASCLFDRSLHFVARLSPPQKNSDPSSSQAKVEPLYANT